MDTYTCCLAQDPEGRQCCLVVGHEAEHAGIIGKDKEVVRWWAPSMSL